MDSSERKKFDLLDERVIYTCPLNQMDVNRRIFFNVESVKLDIDSDEVNECNNGIEIKDKISDNPLIYSIYLDKRTNRGFEKYKNLKKLEVEFESNELEEDTVNAVIRTEGDLVLYDNFEKCVLDADAEFDFDRPIEQFTLKLWRRKDRNE